MYCLSSVKNEIITLKCSNFVYVLGLIKIFQKICTAQIKDVQRIINFFYFPALRFIYFSPLITGINHNHLLNPKKTRLTCFVSLAHPYGSIYSFRVLWSYSRSSFSWFWIYSWIFFAFSLLHLHNNLYTKNNDCHTCIK